MRKRFSRRHNSIVGAYPWAGPAALALIVLALLFFILRIFLPGALVALATPLWVSGNALTAGAGNTLSFFGDKGALIEERNRLEADAAALYAKNAALEAQVADLTRLLGKRTEAGPGVLAGVLSRSPVSPYDTLILDQGTEAGVAVGDRVLGPGGLPLGTIESVAKHSARALLYSTPARETESWVGESRIPLTLIGEGAGAMSAIVAREAGVVEGDQVYVPGPGAVPLGVVVAVGSDPSSPRSRVDIRPLANPFSVTWVTVVP